jgi:hypothetical protein
VGGRARVKPPIKIMIDKFINIFEGYSWAHGLFTKDKSNLPGKVEGTSTVKREEITKAMWENHLNGLEPSLGIMPVNEKSECKWGCIDVDKFDLDYEEILKKTRRLSLPLIMIRSKSGCAHLFLFIRKFIPAEEVLFVLKRFAAQLGIADKLDRIYPMQTKFREGGTGSWLNMPYFNHEEGTRYAYKDNFEAADIEEFFAMHTKYAQDNLDKYLAEEEEPAPEKIINNKKIKEPTFIPCITNCIKANSGKIPKGMRNDFLYQAALFYSKSHEAFSKFEGKKRTPESLLRDFNTNNLIEPESENTIISTQESVKKEGYKYKCKVPNIKKHCEPSKCCRNLFGITPEIAKELYSVEEILGDLFEYGSVPPIYYMYVKVNTKDKKLKEVRVQFKGSELKDKKAFLTKLHNFGHFPPKILELMKPGDFSNFMQEKIDKAIFIEAPEEAHHDHDFVSLMKDFLEKTTVSVDKWDLLEGACYYDPKKKLMHIRLERLQQYLEAKRQPMKTAEVTFRLTKILKGKKNNGYVKTKLGIEKSCPTWTYPEKRENFTLTFDEKESQKEIENAKN